MDTILAYLDNMFVNFPQTPQVQRAKEDLAEMMEDKYNELIAEGKKENEAIGIVISEFGNIQELADEIGLGSAQEYEQKHEKEDAQEHEDMIYLSNAEADEYLYAVKQSAGRISMGILLCICSPILIILLSGIQAEGIAPISDGIVGGIGVSVILIMVSCAAALFIRAGMKLDTFEYLKKERFVIEEGFAQTVYQMRESRKGIFTTKITAGVIMCIVSVIPVIVSAFITEYFSSDILIYISIGFLLIIVGIAITLFITAGMEEESYKVILQEKEFSVHKKAGNKLEDSIGSIYWPVTAMIYLAWSFISSDWGITWIIWPLAGVLFTVICQIIKTMSGQRH